MDLVELLKFPNNIYLILYTLFWIAITFAVVYSWFDKQRTKILNEKSKEFRIFNQQDTRHTKKVLGDMIESKNYDNLKNNFNDEDSSYQSPFTRVNTDILTVDQSKREEIINEENVIKEPEISLFAKSISKNGFYEDMLKEVKEYDSIIKLTLQNNKLSYFEFINDNSEYIKQAIKNYKALIEPHSIIEGNINPSAFKIQTIKKGVLVKDNDLWQVQEKVKIKII